MIGAEGNDVTVLLASCSCSLHGTLYIVHNSSSLPSLHTLVKIHHQFELGAII